MAVRASSSPKPAADIPSTVGASWKSWWNVGHTSSAASEERLLRRLPYYRSPKDIVQLDNTSGVTCTSSQVPLSQHKQYINTVSFLPTHKRSPESPPAVILHGYGAGLGFFYRNFPALGSWVASRGIPVYAVDWLGMGRSSRPPFKIRAKKDDTLARVTETEDFFVNSLEEWRQKMGLDKMTLVGHSLGGYLSVVYALRFPERVERLLLLSPAGVPQDPHAEMPERELDETPPPKRRGLATSTAQPASKEQVKQMHTDQVKKKQNESWQRRMFVYLWEQGWSPFQVIRSSLFLAPLIVAKYSTRRFTGLSEEETKDMHEYILAITLAKGSGEYSISHILAPGAVARLPLVNRVSDIKVPITFVYGDHDWMDPQGGQRSVENLRKAGNKFSKMVIIPNAGHHVYLDNPPAVNDLIVKELDKTLK